jgi:hypothetical protein
VDEQQKPADEQVEELSPEEMDMAKELGLTKEEAEPEKEDEENETPEEMPDKKVEEVPEKKEVEEKKEPPTFEDMEQDPELEHEALKDKSAADKAMYWKWKKDKVKRQDAERNYQHEAIKRKALEQELEKLKAPPQEEMLEGSDEVATKKDLLAIEQRRRAEEEKRTAEQQKAQEISARLNRLESEARNADDKFDAIMELAKEVVDRDPYGVYGTRLTMLAADPEGDVVGYLKSIARMHENYDSVRQSAPKRDGKQDNEKINRAISNAQKRSSSAAVGSGGGGGALSEAEMSVSDAANLTEAQFAKLSPATRERLLMESCR